MFRAAGDFVIPLAILATGCAVAVFKDECPPNEEYLLCGSACPTNCSNYQDPVVCTQQCVEGCFCSLNMVRNENGTCVTPDQCGVPESPPTCGDNEEYLTCGSSCPPSCDQPSPDLCDLACRAGCFCKGGAVRDANGKCVDVTDCPIKSTTPSVCGPNEDYQTCGACDATCEQPVPVACDRACRAGCFCTVGTVRDNEGKCVDVDDCPATPCLNSNEVYHECLGACEPSCSDLTPICSKMCLGGCICAPGTFRSDAGDCVTLDKCLSNLTEKDTVMKYINAINTMLHL